MADRTVTVPPIGDGLEGWTWWCSCGTGDKTGKRWTRDSAMRFGRQHLSGSHPKAALTAVVSPTVPTPPPSSDAGAGDTTHNPRRASDG